MNVSRGVYSQTRINVGCVVQAGRVGGIAVFQESAWIETLVAIDNIFKIVVRVRKLIEEFSNILHDTP